MAGSKNEEGEGLATEFDQKMHIDPQRQEEVAEEVVDMDKFRPKFVARKKRDVEMQEATKSKEEEKVSVELGEDTVNMQGETINEDTEMRPVGVRFGKRKLNGKKRQEREEDE